MPFMTTEDAKRLTTQLETLRDFMIDGRWRTLERIAKETGYPTPSISAQLRHLRKKEHGSFNVERKRKSGGTYLYRVNGRRTLADKIAEIEKALFLAKRHVKKYEKQLARLRR